MFYWSVFSCLTLYNVLLYAPIVLLESIDLILAHYSSIMRHNIPAYYALNYAGIFDGGLALIDIKRQLKQVESTSQ